MIIFEQPMNEIARILLKLEYLFSLCEFHLQRGNPWDCHTLLSGLNDITMLLDRPDLRSKLTKELQRFISSLSKLQVSPDINRRKLSELLQRLESSLQYLLHGNGRLAQSLRDDDFLTNLRQHLMTPAGTSPAEMPVYHLWFTQPMPARLTLINYWYAQLNDIKQVVSLMLELIRDSGQFENRQLVNGFYQTTIDPLLPCHLIRVGLPDNGNLFPEISAGRHRLCIYLMSADFTARPTQSNTNCELQLSLCFL